MKNSTTRFSDRVADYIRYRPHYPAQIIDVLVQETGLKTAHVIADIGAGTGISSLPFIKNGNPVFAVEPNNEMREAAADYFRHHATFTPINATAEFTGLEANSVDYIFCGQAFHWFDKQKTKTEFHRILKPDGHIVLAWNRRDEQDSFQIAYENLLVTHIPEYKKVNHKNITDEEIRSFLSPGVLHYHRLDNHQTFDFSGLMGRLKSSSYCPKEGIVYNLLEQEMKKLFDQFETHGEIVFRYQTDLYWN
jgi:ubiquinone/menaquinone biosynthesis C-methylase UbiE